MSAMSNNPYEPRPDDNPYEQPGGQAGDPHGQGYGQQPPVEPPYGAQQPPAEPPYGAQQPYGQQPPYGQDPYGQQGYGQPAPYGGTPYGMAPQPHPQGTLILVLGIIGLVACFIPGIVALVMGNRALKEIDANPTAYNNRSNVQIGRILGIIGIVWQVGLSIIYGIFIAVAINAGSY
jgi:hypothetical protein